MGLVATKIVSEYDQEIPRSQTADNPIAPRGRAAQPSRDTRKTNLAKQPALSSPVFGVSEKVRLKPVSSSTETS